MENRRLPPRVQQTPPRRVLPAGGQQPPLAPLGPRPLRPSPPARPRTPPRDPHPRPRLVPRRVAMLAQPHPIRPRSTPRPATPHHCHDPHTVGAACPTSPLPSGSPAPLSPNGRPARAERAALDSKPPSATSHGRLTQDVFGDRAGAKRLSSATSTAATASGPCFQSCRQ